MSGFGREHRLCGKFFTLFLANNLAVFCSITENLNETEFKWPRNLFPQGQHTESAVIQGAMVKAELTELGRAIPVVPIFQTRKRWE